MGKDAESYIYDENGKVVGQISPTFDQTGSYTGQAHKTLDANGNVVQTSYVQASEEQKAEFAQRYPSVEAYRARSAQGGAAPSDTPGCRGCGLAMIVGAILITVAGCIWGYWLSNNDPGTQVPSAVGEIRIQQQQDGVAQSLGEPTYVGGYLDGVVVLADAGAMETDAAFDSMLARFLRDCDVDAEKFTGSIVVVDLASCDINWAVVKNESGEPVVWGSVNAVWLNEDGSIRAAMFDI